MIQQKKRAQPIWTYQVLICNFEWYIEKYYFKLNLKILIVSSHVVCAHKNVKFSFGDFILITGLVWIWLIVGEYAPQQINSNESSFTYIYRNEALQKLIILL